MRNRASLALALAVMALSGAGSVAALAWPLKAKLFPLVIGVPLFCLAAAEVLWLLLAKSGDEPAQAAPEEVPPELARRRSFVAAGWIAGFLALVVLLGFPVAVPAFAFLYLKLQGREGWIFSTVFTAAVWAAFYGLFDRLLHLPFPAGWLLEWLGAG